MGSEKNSDDEQTRSRPKPDVVYPATEDPVRTGCGVPGNGRPGENQMTCARQAPDDAGPVRSTHRMKGHIRKYVSESPSRLHL